MNTKKSLIFCTTQMILVLWRNHLKDGDKTIYGTEVLKSNLYDYNNAYILVKHSITVVAATQT